MLSTERLVKIFIGLKNWWKRRNFLLPDFSIVPCKPLSSYSYPVCHAYCAPTHKSLSSYSYPVTLIQ